MLKPVAARAVVPGGDELLGEPWSEGGEGGEGGFKADEELRGRRRHVEALRHRVLNLQARSERFYRLEAVKVSLFDGPEERLPLRLAHAWTRLDGPPLRSSSLSRP